ncbi:type II toxin-antitoxin system RelE/ParE family toxin [Aquincola sp. S2]|uniref:Type II toxin-antitoxin system RelE/ParE family toxin n=1 Tax=Pseudaquabacterium terrae TaxID=2732868 RepID=A0ABX2EBB3_9BURK|nr:type II toxin-antitoxin system RelE/ParE family toxin [Aquabacterium terrae]
MARVELAPEVLDDFDRIVGHLVAQGIDDAAARIQEAIAALDVLEHSPMLGRPVGDDLRELVIGRRARGFVALYRYVPEAEFVFVLAVRSQKEAGYARF